MKSGGWIVRVGESGLDYIITSQQDDKREKRTEKSREKGNHGAENGQGKRGGETGFYFSTNEYSKKYWGARGPITFEDRRKEGGTGGGKQPGWGKRREGKFFKREYLDSSGQNKQKYHEEITQASQKGKTRGHRGSY